MKAVIMISEFGSTIDVLQGLVRSEVEAVYVVHDYGFVTRFHYLVSFPMQRSQIPKVEALHTPPGVRRSIIGRTVFKMILLFYVLIKRQPDIVIGWHVDYSAFAFLGALFFRKPLIVCIDDSPRMWKLRRALMPILKLARCVTTTGSYSRNTLIEQGLRPSSVFVIPNCIDVKKFRRSSSHSNRRYDIVNVGRISAEKNLITFLMVVDSIRKLEPDIRAVVVGEGRLRKVVEDTARKMGLENTVHFPGWTDPRHYLESAKVFVTTTVSEGLPATVLEAMAAGLPCVVPRIDDIPDVAHHGINSFLVDDPYDASGFVTAIMKLLKDADLRALLGGNAEKTVESYTYEAASRAWNLVLAKAGSRRIR